MNIVLTLHPGTPKAFRVELAAESEEAPADMLTEPGHEGLIVAVIVATRMLSGLDGKLVSLGRDATVADLAIIIGKLVGGDMEVAAGRLPPSLLDDPMTALHQDDDHEEAAL